MTIAVVKAANSKFGVNFASEDAAVQPLEDFAEVIDEQSLAVENQL